ncbi:hypothetical protein [Desulfobulbus elongatus]|uniref:hypothetical protein n=1 Tax=Desulfobulbus elongatus TaxID=53332 RepID=UPI0012FA550E|nr:hypothetical protein [Desulfobulbus elongatus]
MKKQHIFTQLNWPPRQGNLLEPTENDSQNRKTGQSDQGKSPVGPKGPAMKKNGKTVKNDRPGKRDRAM